MKMRRTLLSIGLTLGLLAMGAGPAQAQARFGAEALFGSDTDFGVGGRIHLPIPSDAPLEFQGSFDLFFPDGPQDYWEINGNLLYLFDLAGSDVTVPYAGGGLNIGHASVSEFGDETELGLNLVGGARFEFVNTTPFLELRLLFGSAGQLVIGGGVLFG